MAAPSGCYSCLKFLVFIVNFLFWLFGLGVVAVSLWLLFDTHLYLQTMEAERADYYTGTYIVLGVGAVMTIVGFLGCCGAWKESPWMLGTFFVFLVTIFIGEICAGVFIYFQKGTWETLIENSVKHTVMDKYHPNSTATISTFDVIQSQLECCGAEGPTDWANSIFNENLERGREIGIGASIAYTGNYKIPLSCCRLPDSSACRMATELNTDETPNPSIIYTQGCAFMMRDFIEYNIIYLLAIGIGILVIELFGMMFSMCLCCAIKRIDSLKA